VESFFDNLLLPVGGERPRRKTVTKIEEAKVGRFGSLIGKR